MHAIFTRPNKRMIIIVAHAALSQMHPIFTQRQRNGYVVARLALSKSNSLLSLHFIVVSTSHCKLSGSKANFEIPRLPLTSWTSNERTVKRSREDYEPRRHYGAAMTVEKVLLGICFIRGSYIPFWTLWPYFENEPNPEKHSKCKAVLWRQGSTIAVAATCQP